MNVAAYASASPASMTPWRRHLCALAIASAAILLLFSRDAAHMATIWWTSSTFNHCLLIVPIIAWLVWLRAPGLTSINPAPWPAALVIVGFGSIAWLLGEAAGVSLARHLGLIVMLQGTVAALLGRDVARALRFPLFYALFLVPAGEEFVPALQGITAQISMALLRLSGIPAHMQGVFITTPGGYFEVAEACSGVKFLVAMFALGVLVAALCFRSWPRRLLFLGAAIAVPVLANGVRAFATIYVAGASSAAAAESFDHIVYGWFFFGIVIAALIGVSWRFFDRSPDERPRFTPTRSPRASSRGLMLMTALAVTLAAAPVLWTSTAEARARNEGLPSLEAIEVPGWARVGPAGAVAWRPRFAGADRFAIHRYRDPAGREVDLVIAAYAWQAEGRELVGFGQGVDGDWSWSEAGAPPPEGRADRFVSQGVTREVLTFYRVGGLTTGNAAEVKLATLKARLLGRGQASGAVLISSETRSEPARAAIDRFVAALGPIDALSARVAGG